VDYPRAGVGPGGAGGGAVGQRRAARGAALRRAVGARPVRPGGRLTPRAAPSERQRPDMVFSACFASAAVTPSGYLLPAGPLGLGSRARARQNPGAKSGLLWS